MPCNTVPAENVTSLEAAGGCGQDTAMSQGKLGVRLLPSPFPPAFTYPSDHLGIRQLLIKLVCD